MRKKLKEIEQRKFDFPRIVSQLKNANLIHVCYFEMIEDALYIEIYDTKGNLICRHLNNGEEMATENVATGKITPNGFSNLFDGPLWWHEFLAVDETENVLETFLNQNGKICSYIGANLKQVIELVSAKKNEAKKKRKQAKIDEMFSKLSPLPASWNDFIKNQVVPEEFAFSNRSERTVYFSCCDKEISEKSISKFKIGDKIVCPICNKKIEVISIKRKKPYIRKTAVLPDFIDNNLCLRYFTVTKDFIGDYKAPILEVNENVREVLNTKTEKYYELKLEKNWGECIDYSNGWSYSRYYKGIHHNFYDGVLFRRNLKAVLNKTCYANKGIESFVKGEKNGYIICSICESLIDNPGYEQLIKAGYKTFLKEVLYYNEEMRYIRLNGSEKNPREITGLNKKYLNLFKDGSQSFSHDDYCYAYEMLKKASDENIDLSLDKIFFIIKRKDVFKIYDVDGIFNAPISKIDKIYKCCKNANKDYRYYLDYISMVKRLDMSLKSNRYPDNLTREHDRLNELIRIAENKAIEDKFKERLEQMQEFAYSCDGINFVVPTSPEDLKKESSALHHCVASCYTEKYADGYTNLLLIRYEKAIDKPVATMEFNSEGKVIQVRAVNNSTPSTDILSAVEKFKEAKLLPLQMAG